MKTKTIALSIATVLDNILVNFLFYIVLVAMAFSLLFLNGCDDGGGYEATNYTPPADTGDPTPGDDWFCDGPNGVGCTPPPSDTGNDAGTGNPDPGCQPLPQHITLWVENCTNSNALLSGFYVTEQPGLIETFAGVPYLSDTIGGKGVQLTNPSATSCGPLTLGVITLGELSITSDMSMEWFLMDKEIFDLTFQQNHGHAPTIADYQSSVGVQHLQAAFECQWGDNCPLTVAPPKGAVKRLDQTGPSVASAANSCEWGFVVARSL